MRLLLFIIAAFFFGISSFAQPKGIHVSLNGEKKVNTSRTMSITWLNNTSDKGFLKYGLDSLLLNKKAKAEVKYVADLSTHVNKITLRKLAPATYYYYKASSDENGWSDIYKFRTGAEEGDTSKIIVGIWSDTQNNTGNLNFERTDTIVKQLIKNAYHFTLHNGDIVENGSVVKSWKDLFNVTQPINANYPFMSVTGNHDVVNDTASSVFQKPFPIFYELMNLPGNQSNYSYDYGNVHFVAINSGWAEGAAKVGKVLFEDGSEEY